MPNAWDAGVVNMSLQGVPPGKGLQATSNPQLTSKHIRSGLDLLLFCHPLFNAPFVQVSDIHRDTTANPLFRLHPTVVSKDVTFEVGDASVLLEVVASDDGTMEVGFPVDPLGTTFTLEVARGDTTLVRVYTLVSMRSGALLRSGGGRTSGRGGSTTRLGPVSDLALLLLLGGGYLSRTVLFIVIGGRNVVGVTLTIQFGTIRAGGRGGWTDGGRGSDAHVSRSRWGLRVVTMVEVWSVGRHSRRINWYGGQMGSREGLRNGGDGIIAWNWCRWRDFKD